MKHEDEAYVLYTHLFCSLWIIHVSSAVTKQALIKCYSIGPMKFQWKGTSWHAFAHVCMFVWVLYICVHDPCSLQGQRVTISHSLFTRALWPLGIRAEIVLIFFLCFRPSVAIILALGLKRHSNMIVFFFFSKYIIFNIKYI